MQYSSITAREWAFSFRGSEMSEHQQKKKRKAQRPGIQQKQNENPKKVKRDFKTAMKELWMQEENRFLLICAIGLLIIFFSTSLPGKAGLYVQSAIVCLIVIGCVLRNVRGKGEVTDTEEKEESTDEENT